MQDFGAISLEGVADRSAGVKSGLKTIKLTLAENITVNATHICPYQNKCPDDILAEFGEARCGQCWYSIKTIDHLPRIAAKIRSLSYELKQLSAHIQAALDKGGQPPALFHLEHDRKNLAAELSAWIVCHNLLNQMLKNMKNKKEFLVAKPEILIQQAQAQRLESSAMNDLLLRISDAEQYEEYYSPQLKGQLLRISHKVLAKAGLLDEIIKLSDSDDLIQEFKGMLRMVCELSHKSMREVLQEIEAPLQPKPTLLPQVLFDREV